MSLPVRTLIAATALATLSATCAYAGATDQYGTWNGGGPAGGVGSQINNNQVNHQDLWSNLNGTINSISGDAVVQGAAGGNVMDITTMNNTAVNNHQIVDNGASVRADVDVTVSNIGGSVGIQNQALCNGVSVSTDPTYAATRSYQECSAADPSSRTTANVTGIFGDAMIQDSALGNSFEADSNAPNMPIWNKQINNAAVSSSIDAHVTNVGGSTSLTSSAIGNTGQIIHYNTH